MLKLRNYVSIRFVEALYCHLIKPDETIGVTAVTSYLQHVTKHTF